MNKTNEVIEEYLQEVRKEIHNIVPCEDFIASLRHELEDALESAENVDLQKLMDEFGSPESVARDFLESKEALQPKKIAKTKRNRSIVIILLIVTLAAASWYLWDILQQTQGWATEVIVIYE